MGDILNAVDHSVANSLMVTEKKLFGSKDPLIRHGISISPSFERDDFYEKTKFDEISLNKDSTIFNRQLPVIFKRVTGTPTRVTSSYPYQSLHRSDHILNIRKPMFTPRVMFANDYFKEEEAVGHATPAAELGLLGPHFLPMGDWLPYSEDLVSHW